MGLCPRLGQATRIGRKRVGVRVGSPTWVWSSASARPCLIYRWEAKSRELVMPPMGQGRAEVRERLIQQPSIPSTSGTVAPETAGG